LGSWKKPLKRLRGGKEEVEQRLVEGVSRKHALEKGLRASAKRGSTGG